MKIAINFYDNDFRKTFIGIGNILLASYENDSEGFIKMNKRDVVIIVNELALGVYLSFQNYFSYSNGMTPEGYRNHIKKYLTMETKNILFDDEVDKYLLECEGDNNHESLIIDFIKKQVNII